MRQDVGMASVHKIMSTLKLNLKFLAHKFLVRYHPPVSTSHLHHMVSVWLADQSVIIVYVNGNSSGVNHM